MIEFHQINRTHGDFTAVRSLAFAVDSADVFEFLAADGAGQCQEPTSRACVLS